ncbi:endonuclease V [Motilimonas eburnea]|uniref:endonuclease V n=1 Tax=Motilimonas eburnea TaxID=1737488 RepID=UPI001E5530DD|nr:endonuclease V [Motilimonas eburnea]MCE2573743.1 endonuclease V [Motilimonas eburnea]
MKLAIDVQYVDDKAVVAGVLFRDWDCEHVYETIVKEVSPVAPYEPGSFYKRELPCILSLLDDVAESIETIIVDGYVNLGAEQAAGLGMHLYKALGETINVIGVAKKPFKDTPRDCEVFRGKSLNPLYVTAVGISLDEAKLAITKMHGKHRHPTLLKKADQLCRGICCA